MINYQLLNRIDTIALQALLSITNRPPACPVVFTFVARTFKVSSSLRGTRRGSKKVVED